MGIGVLRGWVDRKILSTSYTELDHFLVTQRPTSNYKARLFISRWFILENIKELCSPGLALEVRTKRSNEVGKTRLKTSILLSRNAPFSIGPMGEMTDESRFGETCHIGKGHAQLSCSVLSNEINKVKICEVFTFWYF